MGKFKNVKKPRKPVVDNSRKALRKQKRLEKKVHRQEHYLKKKNTEDKPKYTAGRFVKRPADYSEPVTEKKKPKLQSSAQEILSKEREKDIRQANKLKSEMDKRRTSMLLKANEDEDKLIKKLEKQLGLNKSKNKNNYFADDGLDYLLEICERTTSEQIVAAEKHLAEVEGDSDFEDDLAAVTGKDLAKKDKKSKKIDHTNDSELDDEIGSGDHEISSGDDEIGSGDDEIGDDSKLSDESDLDEELSENDDLSDEDATKELAEDSDFNEEPEEHPAKIKRSKKATTTKTEKVQNVNSKEVEHKPKPSKERIIKADALSKAFSDDEISHLSGDDDDDDDDMEGLSGVEIGDDQDDSVSKKKEEKPDVWEDIYGRKRDKEGNIIKEEKGFYIPPHLRNKDSASSKEFAQLKRQIKSVLNKLAGTNLHWACTSIESLYSNNSRNSVNTVLTELWLEATVGPSLTPDRLVTEHAALVSVLHANVGSEIGAHFLQELVKRFDEMVGTSQPVEDKHLDNLVACLAQLYNFKVYDAPLLLDMITRLVESLSEKHIDCVLVALRSAGAGLRRAAPAELRGLVHQVQRSATGLSETASTGSRIKFLLEVLMAIKNNNLMKIPNYDPSYQEHLKKTTRSIVRKGNYITPLNIRLEDLLKADERGKWWVVGSAWEGSAREHTAAPAATVPAQDQKLLELARKQRMNTDVRRSIFCVIMAAEDYMDAFEKLQQLGLTGQQAREIVHVLLACCLQEKTYNPYYAVLARKLCDTDRKYQLSIQFAVWDKIKDIENQTRPSLSNLAQFLIHLIMEKGLALSVLKVIQFSDLNKQSVRFMRQVLLSIIMNENLQSTLEVFHRVAKSPKLHMFRESLKLFIQHFLIKNAGKKSNVLSDNEMVKLKERAAEVDKILTMYDSKLRF